MQMYTTNIELSARVAKVAVLTKEMGIISEVVPPSGLDRRETSKKFNICWMKGLSIIAVGIPGNEHMPDTMMGKIHNGRTTIAKISMAKKIPRLAFLRMMTTSL